MDACCPLCWESAASSPGPGMVGAIVLLPPTSQWLLWKARNEVQLSAVWRASYKYFPHKSGLSGWYGMHLKEIIDLPFNLKLMLTTLHYPMNLLHPLCPFLCTSECTLEKSGNRRHFVTGNFGYVKSRKVIDNLNPIWKHSSFKTHV